MRLPELLQRLLAHRRRLAPLVLIVGVLLVGSQLWEAVPQETEIHYRLGPQHEEIRSISLSYQTGGEEVVRTDFRWPAGAPRTVPHAVSLPPAEYLIEAEVRASSGSRHLERRLAIPAEGLVSIDLFDVAYAEHLEDGPSFSSSPVNASLLERSGRRLDEIDAGARPAAGSGEASLQLPTGQPRIGS